MDAVSTTLKPSRTECGQREPSVVTTARQALRRLLTGIQCANELRRVRKALKPKAISELCLFLKSDPMGKQAARWILENLHQLLTDPDHKAEIVAYFTKEGLHLCASRSCSSSTDSSGDSMEISASWAGLQIEDDGSDSGVSGLAEGSDAESGHRSGASSPTSETC